MVVRTLAAMRLDPVSQAALSTLMNWAFGLEGTLSMTGLTKVPLVLETLEQLPLEPGESEEERQQVRAKITERLLK